MDATHSAEDLEWARSIMADRPRLDKLIQEMRDGVPSAYDEIVFLTECFNNGMPCADEQGRMGRLVHEDDESADSAHNHTGA